MRKLRSLRRLLNIFAISIFPNIPLTNMLLKKEKLSVTAPVKMELWWTMSRDKLRDDKDKGGGAPPWPGRGVWKPSRLRELCRISSSFL